MINKIVTKYHSIDIFKSPQIKCDKNLFSADSLMLLIGENGSGKTEILTSIFKKIKNDKDKSTEITFENSDEVNKNYVIYYTPVPFGGVSLEDGANAFFVKPHDYLSESINEDFAKMSESLKEVFDIKHKSVLKVLNFTTKDLTDFKEKLFNISSKINSAELQSLVEEYEKLNNLKPSTAQENDSFLDYKKYENDLMRKFIVILSEVGGELFTLKLRAYKASISNNNWSSSGFEKVIQEFGFSFKEKLSESEARMRQRYKFSLEKLIHLNNKFNGRLLSEYKLELNADEHRIISGMKIYGVAEVFYEKLSSGGAALIHQFGSFESIVTRLNQSDSSLKEKNLILLIDEGDAFLHFEWQSKYIKFLNKFLESIKENFKTLQVFLTSHSPYLMGDFPREAIYKITNEDLIDKISRNNRDEKTFAATIGDIIGGIGESPTIGSFASEKIIELIEDIKKGEEIFEYRIQMIGDNVIRNQILNLLKKTRHD